ncbi:MAG: acetylornithine transaminase [Oscillospiraceae bacterium]|nr:acetylornithine transaminase [Oscillospiraceae bacterium]
MNVTTLTTLKAQYDAYILPTYARRDAAFARGVGCRLYDVDGKEYIDMSSGIGVNSVGYAHPDWVAAVAAQAGTLAHASNLFYTEPAARLAERLCALSGMAGAFFANSGAEANEGVFKVARKYSESKYGAGRATIATLTGSFHGRTLTTLAATGQGKFHRQFNPLTPGFLHIPPGDIDALHALPGDVCAVMLEPVQGEGGVWPLEAGYVKQVEALCRERDWLLLCDEVQTGIGRTGHWFGFQGLGITPDALSFAKGIAGGLPMGGFLVGEGLRGVLTPGDHAATFGGSPLCCAAALATLDILEGALPTVLQKGEAIRARIEAMGLPNVAGTRGRGLMIGVSVTGGEPSDWNDKLLEAGLVALTAGTDALRFLPPLIIGEGDIEAALAIFEKVMRGGSTQ